ncbi:MAG: SnoaL-like domain-containing protein [Myxococcales bacterium]|nr:SnoaL-like domain-containing protein [Myxococcales bacterium]
MSGEANKDIVRRAGDAFGRGDWEELVGLMHDNVAYTLIGSTAFSGTLRGRAAVFEMLSEGLAPSLSTPGIVMSVDNLIAEGEYVAEQARGASRTESGAEYNNSYCRIWRIVEGQILSMTEYLDTELLGRAFDTPSAEGERR